MCQIDTYTAHLLQKNIIFDSFLLYKYLHKNCTKNLFTKILNIHKEKVIRHRNITKNALYLLNKSNFGTPFLPFDFFQKFISGHFLSFLGKQKLPPPPPKKRQRIFKIKIEGVAVVYLINIFQVYEIRNLSARILLWRSLAQTP